MMFSKFEVFGKEDQELRQELNTKIVTDNTTLLKAIISDTVIFCNTRDNVLQKKLSHLEEQIHVLETGLDFEHSSDKSYLRIDLASTVDNFKSKYVLEIKFKEY